MEAGLTEISGLCANRFLVAFTINDELSASTEGEDGLSPRFKASLVNSWILILSPDNIRLAAVGVKAYELAIIA
ncbi:MAG: hypothetical protein M1464_03110, partial [Candidatus Thermoplasmatota archaeon]|nr:hypothetical protein [Candidatus Thermoplasmatota archaeon]